MQVLPSTLDGPVLMAPTAHEDARGFFVETFRADELERHGIRDTFVQDNHSRSVGGTLRGLHYQAGPGQAKLLRVARGAIWDVVVDLRPASATYGRWESFTLDDHEHHLLYVPVGFAHGFCVLSDEADVLYRVTTYYDPALERGLAWDDPDLAIAWPVSSPILSDRDRRNPTLRQLEPGTDPGGLRG